MFIDEKTNIKIYADLDSSVSRATLQAKHLVPAFIEVIKDTPEWAQISCHPNLSYSLKIIFEPIWDDSDTEETRWESEEMSYFLNKELFEILNNYAPDGYYFGAHPADGSDFGFWKIEEN